MTAQEVVNTVRLLIDSGHEWYADFAMLERIINTAQMKILEAYVAKGEERVFRNLVVLESNLQVNDINKGVIRTAFAIFQPRHCIIKVQPPNEGELFVRQLSYMAPPLFFNDDYLGRKYLRAVTNLPRIAYWTYKNLWDLTNAIQYSEVEILNYNENANYFQDGNVDLYLTYIRYPFLFSLATAQNLELADEVHLEVAALAAELVNTIDVLEYERGLALPPESGARITLDKTGAIR